MVLVAVSVVIVAAAVLPTWEKGNFATLPVTIHYRHYFHKQKALYHLAERCQRHPEWPAPADDHRIQEPVLMLLMHPRSQVCRRTPAPCPRTHHVSAAAEPLSVERHSSTLAVDASEVCCDRRHRRLWLHYREDSRDYTDSTSSKYNAFHSVSK